MVKEAEQGVHVSLTKGVKRFEKKGKLSPRYIGPFKVLKCMGIVAYHLALQPNLSDVYLVFYVSMLKKYVPNPLHVIQYEEVQLQNRLTYEQQPVTTLDQQVLRLCSKDISMVKVLWQSHSVNEETWELKDEMQAKYPYPFKV
ncbi:PREDICTED: uncharacterized protein LOC108661932 [Theobroma cacao]|uniref:Uncharacterized protein LOC108661932 n=1 Tax=Theobroma cacao TaxID=3641 RepID=A0AB32WC86_THECC|nr:PREDICTED: uncharacterized protein LOC108661932 [Theobroma cacao]